MCKGPGARGLGPVGVLACAWLCCGVICGQQGTVGFQTSLRPETGAVVVLFHPRRDRWQDHFRLAGAHIDPLTPTGRVTVRLLRLNHPNRIEERELVLRLGPLLPPGPHHSRDIYPLSNRRRAMNAFVVGAGVTYGQ